MCCLGGGDHMLTLHVSFQAPCCRLAGLLILGSIGVQSLNLCKKKCFEFFIFFPNCLCALLLACFFAAPNCYLSFQVSLILVKLCAAMFMMLLMLIMKFVQPSSALSWWLWRVCVLPRRR